MRKQTRTVFAGKLPTMHDHFDLQVGARGEFGVYGQDQCILDAYNGHERSAHADGDIEGR